MARSATTTSLYQSTATLLRKICRFHRRTQPEQINLLVEAEARKLGLIEEASHQCPECGGDLLAGSGAVFIACRNPACDYVSPNY